MNIYKQSRIVEYADNLMGSPVVLDMIEAKNQVLIKRDALLEKRLEIEQRLYDLYSRMCKDGEIGEISFSTDNSVYDSLQAACFNWLTDSEEATDLRHRLKSSVYNDEIAILENECAHVIFEGMTADLELHVITEESREQLFSEKYRMKMQEYAQQGILLYDIDIPMYPLLDPEITEADILDSFLIDDCASLKDMFGKMLVEENLPIKLARKVEDLKCAIIALENGEYRSSARNLFALLEGEHKDCASVWDGYFKKLAGIKKGKARSEEIQKYVEGMNCDYYKKVWNDVDQLYKQTTAEAQGAIVNRNAIIHGDYDSEKIDITAHDVIKLMLLYCNMRIISCQVATHTDMLQQLINYGIVIEVQHLKNTNS